MFKYTTNTLKKLDQLFRESGYIIRYEKGHFTSGYCILKEKKVVVINKFFSTEARINSLVEILGEVEISEDELSEKSLELLKEAKPKST